MTTTQPGECESEAIARGESPAVVDDARRMDEIFARLAAADALDDIQERLAATEAILADMRVLADDVEARTGKRPGNGTI